MIMRMCIVHECTGVYIERRVLLCVVWIWERRELHIPPEPGERRQTPGRRAGRSDERRPAVVTGVSASTAIAAAVAPPVAAAATNAATAAAAAASTPSTAPVVSSTATHINTQQY